MSVTRINRYRLLRRAAVSSIALAFPHTALSWLRRAPVTIEFWNPVTDPQGLKVFTKFIDQFNNTIGKVKGIAVRNRPVPADNDYIKYTTAMTSSGSPDVILTFSYDLVPSWAANGFIQPLDAVFRQLQLDPRDLFPVVWQMVHMNGHIWGLVHEFDLDQLFWNKAIHQSPPPKSIAELDAVAARHTEFDKDGNLIQAGLIPWDQPWHIFDWAAVWGAQFYDPARGKWTIDTPQNRKVLEWYLKYAHILGDRYKADALVSTVPVSLGGDLFPSGRVAFAVEGEYQSLGWAQQPGWRNFGIAHLPTVSSVPYGQSVTLGGNAYLLPAKAAYPHEAAVFIQYMNSPSVVIDVDVSAPLLPPFKSVAYSRQFRRVLPDSFLSTLKSDHIVRPIPSPLLPVFKTEIASAVDAVTYKKKTPAAALTYVDQRVSAAVRHFRQFHPTWPSE